MQLYRHRQIKKAKAEWLGLSVRKRIKLCGFTPYRRSKDRVYYKKKGEILTDESKKICLVEAQQRSRTVQARLFL